MTTTSHRIVPHLWYDTEAKEAATFYSSVFPDSRITSVAQLHDTPSGDCDLVAFELWGQPFKAISAGPYFRFTPAMSFVVNFDPLFFGAHEEEARAKLDAVWEKLSAGGTALMPVGEYPFSKRYGWVQDRYGLSWQLMLTDPAGEPRPPIMPMLLFVGQNCGRAEAAMAFYQSVFRDTRQGNLVRHGAGQAPDTEGTILFADFMLENHWFAIMDSAHPHQFGFNEAVSFMVNCDSQAQINHYWDGLSAVPEAEQCGWLKDRYGVSWQVVPASLDEMLRKGSREQVARVTQAFLKMKKFDLAALQKAFDGNTAP